MVVEHVVSGAREAIDWLIDQGVALTKADKSFHLTREGGYSHRRILHAADAATPMPLDGPSKTHSTGTLAQPKTSILIIILSQFICVLTGAVGLELNVSVVAMC